MRFRLNCAFAALMLVAVMSTQFATPAYAASLLSEQIKIMLNMIRDVFRTSDSEAVKAIIAKRDALPDEMLKYYDDRRDAINNESGEIKKNMDERQARTGKPGIPVWPQTAEMLAILDPLFDKTFQLSFQNGLAAGYAPYPPVIKAIADGLTPPEPPPADPFVPPISGLQSGIAYFTGEAGKIRQGANALKAVHVSGAGTAQQLIQNLNAAQGQLKSAKGVHAMSDGAVDGMVNGLEKFKVIAVGMSERYDYFNEDLVNGMVDLANGHLQNDSAGELEKIAEYVESIAKSLNDILKGIQAGTEGAAAGAAAAVSKIEQDVVIRKANAEAAVAGLAAQVAQLEIDARIYYFENLRDKDRHCFHEKIIYKNVEGYYAQVDEYNRLSKPAELLAAFNSDLWPLLGAEILRIDNAQTADVTSKIQALARAAGASVSVPTGDELPPITHGRFSNTCATFVPDPGKLVVTTESFSSDVQTSAGEILKVNREIKRRQKVGRKNACAPTNEKCLKKAAKLQKQLNKYRSTVNSRSKSIRKQIPARLNKAYFDVYKAYPITPFH